VSQILINLTNNAIKFTERARWSFSLSQQQEAAAPVLEPDR